MSSFFWHQRVGGADAWVEALSEHRSKIIAETRPAFVTVLDAHTSPNDSFTREDYAKMRFSGPAYFDWDSEKIEETIPPFQEFLKKLSDIGTNLNCLRLYATGGRGFHCEIPEAVFMAKVPKTGTASLPYIYKEMAFGLVVETLDMRVYTGRKGRMWRVPGIERSNGKFKVPITLDEAQRMTPELFDQLCSAPRAEVYRETPTLSTGLAALFAKASSLVSQSVKVSAKSKGDEATLARHKGQFPPTALRLMAGDGVLPGKGFHHIAMQLALTANALGKSEEEFIRLSEGLAQHHQGDSERYNSPRKRKDELARMWNYTHDNPCYTYSKGGLRSILAPGEPSPDLDDPMAAMGIGHVPEEGEEQDLPAEFQAELDAAENSILDSMMIMHNGVWRRTGEGPRMLSNLSFRSPVKLCSASDGEMVGLEADLYCSGKSLGRQLMDMPVFQSRANLSRFCSGRAAIFSGNDTQAGVVQLLLSTKAEKKGKVIYVVHKEGLDLIQDPTVADERKLDVIWAHTEGVLCHEKEGLYRFKPQVSTSPMFKTDIHHAQKLENTEDTKVWLRSLMSINSPVIVAQMLGWFVSCFHKQFYQASYNQFPLLHPNGPAGSGKTLTTLLMARMFHVTSQPLMMSCARQASTAYNMKAAWTGSASIPLILDEYKPSELDKERTDFLLQHFRLVYNQGAGASGGIHRGSADASFRDITKYTYSAPTVFIGESQEMMTAIVQRTLPISFNPGDAGAHTADWDLANAGAKYMPQLGRLLLGMSLRETVESRRETLDPVLKSLRASFDKNIHDRQVYNLSVVLCGIRFLGQALEEIFGEEFKPEIETLNASVYDHKSELNISVMSEISKVLNDMSMISRTEGTESEYSIRETYEYVIGEGYIEILMREAFVKYFSWNKRKGFNPLFHNVDAFIAAAGKSPALMDKTCFDSPLRTSGQSRVFRFSLDKLTAEDIEMFKSAR